MITSRLHLCVNRAHHIFLEKKAVITDGDVILTEALNNMLSNEETIHFFYPLIYDAHCCEIGPLDKIKFCSGLDEKFVPLLEDLELNDSARLYPKLLAL